MYLQCYKSYVRSRISFDWQFNLNNNSDCPPDSPSSVYTEVLSGGLSAQVSVNSNRLETTDSPADSPPDSPSSVYTMVLSGGLSGGQVCGQCPADCPPDSTIV